VTAVPTGIASPAVPRRRYKGERATLIATAAAAVGAITVNALGVSGLPGWAFLAASTGVILAVSALTFAVLGAASHRIPALWSAVALLTMTLAGSWIYSAASAKGSPSANFVADKFVTFSLQPGGPPESTYDAKALVEGSVNTARCYVKLKGQVWLNFGNDQWLARTNVHPAPGYPDRLPPKCG
jgi:hypothetical protein